ncbi:unnamed protein product, partial [Rotaria magnacalcarata]
IHSTIILADKKYPPYKHLVPLGSDVHRGWYYAAATSQ